MVRWDVAELPIPAPISQTQYTSQQAVEEAYTLHHPQSTWTAHCTIPKRPPCPIEIETKPKFSSAPLQPANVPLRCSSGVLTLATRSSAASWTFVHERAAPAPQGPRASVKQPTAQEWQFVNGQTSSAPGGAGSFAPNIQIQPKKTKACTHCRDSKVSSRVSNRALTTELNIGEMLLQPWIR